MHVPPSCYQQPVITTSRLAGRPAGLVYVAARIELFSRRLGSRFVYVERYGLGADYLTDVASGGVSPFRAQSVRTRIRFPDMAFRW